MSMTKHGNTLAPGDAVATSYKNGIKTAHSARGEVLNVDVDRGLVQVKWAAGAGESWVSFDELERV
jgi:hypothetical protein